MRFGSLKAKVRMEEECNNYAFRPHNYEGVFFSLSTLKSKEREKMSMSKSKRSNLEKLALAAVFCALALGSMFVFRIQVAGFLTFDTKDAIIALCSLLLGPVYGVVAAAAVSILELITVSGTGFWGLVMNFLSTGTFALTCGIIYKYKRTFAGAIIAVIMSVISVTTVMLLANLFIVPLYMTGVSRSDVAGMIPALLLPFNLTKATLNAAIVLAVYKPISSALKKADLLPDAGDNYRFGLRSVILIVCAVLVIVAAILVFALVLNGDFQFIFS